MRTSFPNLEVRKRFLVYKGILPKRRHLFYTNVFMSFTGGFADAGTYTAANHLFSAHVTGNFIVFAYKLVNNQHLNNFIGLITFPVFAAAIYFTGKSIKGSQSEKRMTIFIGLLLCIAAALAYLIDIKVIDSKFIYNTMLMTIVFAMGIQNSLNKIFAKSTYGPTTMMTGNVINFILSLSGAHEFESKTRKIIQFRRLLSLIFSFFIGCLAGAYFCGNLGLVAMAIPGLLIILYFSVLYRRVSL